VNIKNYKNNKGETNFMSNKKNVQVAQFNKNGELLAKYASLTEAAYWSEAQVAHIGKVANGKRKTAGGFIWKNVGKTALTPFTTRTVGVRQTDEDGNIVAVYATPEIAATMTSISAKRITKAMTSKRKTAGYNWS